MCNVLYICPPTTFCLWCGNSGVTCKTKESLAEESKRMGIWEGKKMRDDFALRICENLDILHGRPRSRSFYSFLRHLHAQVAASVKLTGHKYALLVSLEILNCRLALRTCTNFSNLCSHLHTSTTFFSLFGNGVSYVRGTKVYYMTVNNDERLNNTFRFVFLFFFSGRSFRVFDCMNWRAFPRLWVDRAIRGRPRPKSSYSLG